MHHHLQMRYLLPVWRPQCNFVATIRHVNVLVYKMDVIIVIRNKMNENEMMNILVCGLMDYTLSWSNDMFTINQILIKLNE